MAKAKSGGTRSYLRGRIANDVYSIGKDAKGKKQQVVRSLAESVANPQTLAQMKGRMIMSTVMQAVAALAPIIDHSFDNVAIGQPSISEFIRLNYAAVKNEVTTSPARSQYFSINKYQQKGALTGRYQVSQGKVVFPNIFAEQVYASGLLKLAAQGADATAATFRKAFGLGADDYITLLRFTDNASMTAVRLRPSSTLPGDTVITKDNFLSLFTLEAVNGGKVVVSTEGEGAAAQFMLLVDNEAGSASGAMAVIISKKVETGYEHSTSFMECDWSIGPSNRQSADEALSTYPIGSQRFLNGGEL